MSKKAGNKRRGESSHRVIGSRCCLCHQPFIYTRASGKPSTGVCPVCWNERVGSQCLDLSLRLAFFVDRLDRAATAVKRSTVPETREELGEIAAHLGRLRDELAGAAPQR